jgi:hypothetical protein
MIDHGLRSGFYKNIVIVVVVGESLGYLRCSVLEKNRLRTYEIVMECAQMVK